MNGKPGDHPITDIVCHQISVYGDPLDAQLRRLGDLMSYQRLCDWFEQHWSKTQEELAPLVAAKLEKVRRDVQERAGRNPFHETGRVATPSA